MSGIVDQPDGRVRVEQIVFVDVADPRRRVPLTCRRRAGDVASRFEVVRLDVQLRAVAVHREVPVALEAHELGPNLEDLRLLGVRREDRTIGAEHEVATVAAVRDERHPGHLESRGVRRSANEGDEHQNAGERYGAEACRPPARLLATASLGVQALGEHMQQPYRK